MQTTLRINTKIYREAKVAAARQGITLTHFIEKALSNQLRNGTKIRQPSTVEEEVAKEIIERDLLMEALLRRTAHFRIGPRPTREEMNER